MQVKRREVKRVGYRGESWKSVASRYKLKWGIKYLNKIKSKVQRKKQEYEEMDLPQLFDEDRVESLAIEQLEPLKTAIDDFEEFVEQLPEYQITFNKVYESVENKIKFYTKELQNSNNEVVSWKVLIYKGFRDRLDKIEDYLN